MLLEGFGAGADRVPDSRVGHHHEMEQLKPDSSTASLRGHGKAHDQIIPMSLFTYWPGCG
jgi:hypothetical protein